MVIQLVVITPNLVRGYKLLLNGKPIDYNTHDVNWFKVNFNSGGNDDNNTSVCSLHESS